jgi:hypothetical protein
MRETGTGCTFLFSYLAPLNVAGIFAILDNLNIDVPAAGKVGIQSINE